MAFISLTSNPGQFNVGREARSTPSSWCRILFGNIDGFIIKMMSCMMVESVSASRLVGCNRATWFNFACASASNEQDFFALLCQSYAQIDRRGGLADTAFLVG